ncbi:hypothetical protein Pmar_PMAR018617 [Perkinsus marinus ATCC 50983]|uniref:Uncharacterized protein n=1 Tax=Perkinsus marinus (strain ATCC 50983 / TXsc) TaxID=423536 RepID=C5L0B4_PERM5|nr:hypothetical protein Pmar_PMAR018617 [Perkinsus marinus ATCC 50983]EER09972.1 hypothetical protein Pmar_PMAR018617 [Perkinsus marinus ATCC 50983]|eukprot:XP_002778177.1 hypothetical protein Pmar_PMAR018617 [Perkinsus marinus ATCC 50983]
MLSSVVNTSISWCQANLPVQAARERIPLVNTSLRVADAYGMPVVVKVDSIIDGIIDKGNYYVANVRGKSVAAFEAVEGMRGSLRKKEEAVRNKVGDLVTEKKNEFANAKHMVITKVNNTYHVLSSRLQKIPNSIDFDIHVLLDQDSWLVGAMLGMRDRVLAIAAKGLDMTLGEERRSAIFERGSVTYERALDMACGFLGVERRTTVAVPTSPSESSQAATDKVSETSTVEPVNVLKEQKESLMVDEKHSVVRVESKKCKNSGLPK